MEAVTICGYLEANGIWATYDPSGVVGRPLGGAPYGGPSIAREGIRVRAEDAERARKLLEEANEND
jgi:hypothetical protein